MPSTFEQVRSQMKSEQRRVSDLLRRTDNAEREVRYLTADLARMKIRAEYAEAKLASLGLAGGTNGQR